MKLRVEGAASVDYSDDGWSEFKKWLDGTYASLRYIWAEDASTYAVIAADGLFYRGCSMNKGGADAADFEANFKSYSQVGVVPTNEGRMPTSACKPVAPKLTFITPNWCDKTTWYAGSTEVVDEVATDSGDHTNYSVSHQNMIDAYHGKITFEENLKDDDGSNYRVRVKVNGITKTEQDPHYATGGDFTINYAAGTITFLSLLEASDVVEVTYHYANRATFVLKPEAGKKLYIDTVEVQFSDDIELNDSCVFQAYGYVQVFAPQLMQPPYNIPLNTKIPLGDPLVYKTFNDFLNDSNAAYPSYPAIGGSNWRAMKKPAYLFIWEYAVGATCLQSAYGMEVHIDLQHDAPCGGTFGVATLYCTSE